MSMPIQDCALLTLRFQVSQFTIVIRLVLVFEQAYALIHLHLQLHARQ